MKTCTVCHVERALEAFGKHPHTRDGRGSQCKGCDASEKRRRSQARKAELVASLGGACSVCGYSWCLAALDFHHTDPNKEASVADLLAKRPGRARVEAAKCVLLCANCHREHHAAA